MADFPSAIKINGSLPEGSSTGENIFRLPTGAAREAEKEDLIELSQSSRVHDGQQSI